MKRALIHRHVQGRMLAPFVMVHWTSEAINAYRAAYKSARRAGSGIAISRLMALQAGRRVNRGEVQP